MWPMPTSRHSLLLALLGLSISVTACQTASPTQSRTVYSSIEAEPVTTDAGGMELELRSAAGSADLLFVVCEGGCWGAVPGDVSLEATAVSFSWRSPLAGPDEAPERFVLRRIGDVLVVDAPAWARGEVLKKVRRPAADRTREWASYH